MTRRPYPPYLHPPPDRRDLREELINRAMVILIVLSVAACFYVTFVWER